MGGSVPYDKHGTPYTSSHHDDSMTTVGRIHEGGGKATWPPKLYRQ